jgi:hypothetical protein
MKGDPVSVIDEIKAERDRQVSAEGWTAEHDDGHNRGELALAGACYAASTHPSSDARVAADALWPWDDKWWKPTTRRRDLIKAAALIVAEIERLDRAVVKIS